MNVGWSAEWYVALRRRRLLALNITVPLLLVAPLAAGAAPAHHGAAVAAVLFVVFGVFGSAIPLVRDAGSGLLSRWLLAGVRQRRWLAGRAAAQTVLDVLQLVPSLALLVLLGGGSGAAWLPLVLALVLSLLVANLLGIWVAAAARSLAEAALFGSVAALLLLHAGGVFRTPPPGSWQARAETLIPFRVLHDALLSALAAEAPQMWPDIATWGVAAGFAGLTLAAAPALLGRLSGVEVT